MELSTHQEVQQCRLARTLRSQNRDHDEFILIICSVFLRFLNEVHDLLKGVLFEDIDVAIDDFDCVTFF